MAIVNSGYFHVISAGRLVLHIQRYVSMAPPQPLPAPAVQP